MKFGIIKNEGLWTFCINFVQALFLMPIKNIQIDCRDFDFLLFRGIKSESNQ